MSFVLIWMQMKYVKGLSLLQCALHTRYNRSKYLQRNRSRLPLGNKLDWKLK